MSTHGDEAFARTALREGYLTAEDLEEGREARAKAEEMLGRRVALDHVLLQQGWLTADEVERIQAIIRRRIALCPHCWSRINTHGLRDEAHLRCPLCRKRLTVPPDPHAEVLRGEPAVAGPAATAGGSLPLSQSGLREKLGLHGFEILEQVGAGGMGVVFRALQHPRMRLVALKVLHAHLAQDRVGLRRFAREARAGGAVHHPNLVPIEHAGCTDGLFFLVMPWIQGTSLLQRLQEDGAETPAQVFSLALDVARGLGALHERSLVHRDVKPSNILVRADGTACLTDFGLVRSSAHESEALTKTGDCVGTLQYMPPEQLEDPRAVTASSDIYSLGATVFHALTGSPPFGSEPAPAVCVKLVRREIPRLAELPSTRLPRGTVELVHRMMAPEPRDRFSDVSACGDALTALLQSLPGGKRPWWDEDTKLPG